MVFIGETLFCWCLQRLADLQASTVSSDIKMTEAETLANNLASRFLASDKEKQKASNMLLAYKTALQVENR